MGKGLLLALGMAVGLVGLVWISARQFDRTMDAKIGELLASAHSGERIVTEQDLESLPNPVRIWLQTSGIVGQAMPSTVRLRQVGRIRSGPESSWMSFRADQYYVLEPAAFIWRVYATMGPGLFVRGFDSFVDGLGRMQMKPLALFSVVDASGSALDQGAALRYLQETVWFPYAALLESIRWEPIDECHARAILHTETGTVEGTFQFDEEGHVTAFEADRYRDEDPEPTLRPWRAVTCDETAIAGMSIPIRGEGIWELPDGPFTYVELELVDLDLDVPRLYPR